jgi:LysM repeat protein
MPPRLRTLFAIALIVSLLITTAPPTFADSQTHIVQPGETLFRIALNYGVTVEALQAANGLTNYIIYSGQMLIIPDPNAPASAVQPAPQTSSGTHIVQPGETLFRIGLKYGVSWLTIQAANGLSGTYIYAGQQLIIPGSDIPAATNPTPEPPPQPTQLEPTVEPTQPEPTAEPTQAPTPEAQPPPTEPPPTSPPAENGEVIHIVQSDETLFMIGLKYNLQWTVIQAANNLIGTIVYPGQRLVIPSSSAGFINPSTPPLENIAPPAGSGKRFLVDISEQRLYAFEDDTLVRTTLVSTGLWPYPTVIGTFHVYLRYTSANMTGPGYFLPSVPYVMYFYKGYGLHGTYWHNNFGHPMSHGCVNMPTSEAEWAYNWSTYGTTVIVQN